MLAILTIGSQLNVIPVCFTQEIIKGDNDNCISNRYTDPQNITQFH